MIDRDTLLEVVALGEKRRAERRNFLKMAAATGTVVGAASLLAACDNDTGSGSTPTPTPTATATASSLAASDVDVLNFALSLEYLEANYYISAAYGKQLDTSLQSGIGQQGKVTGGRSVSFADASVAAYAREIASDEYAHVQFLRKTLGSAAVAMPDINIDGTSSTGAFSLAAQSAKIVGAGGTFDPYASDDNWLLGGMLLTDVGVTAYKGSATLISSKVILEAAAGILAVEAYHSGLIRTLLYRRGVNTPTDRTNADKISVARDTLDGNTTSAGPPQLYAKDDIGLSPTTINGQTASTIVPADANAIVFGRTAPNVLNIQYLTAKQANSGGFFPSGINGNIKTSNANG